MKLNPDCIRDILLALEELVVEPVEYIIPNWEILEYEGCFSKLAKYTPDEIAIHIQQCVANNFLLDAKIPCSGGLNFRDLSPRAHEFLANIREDKSYNIVKQTAAKIGAFSLHALESIAAGVTDGLISSVFKL